MQSVTPYNIFRLLVPVTGATPPNAPTIELEGATWTTTDEAPMVVGDLPEYTAISYSWGSGRTAHPFIPDQSMSDRVIPAIETTIRTLRPAAIWIDALCFPVREPARTACLRSMGALYGSAAQVIAVLSKPCSALLEEVARRGCLDDAALLLLENDEWVSRAWTYQEIVNSKTFWFAAEGSSVSLRGMQFLSDIGSAIENYKQAHRWDSFLFRTRHPRLDNLEDTIADWLTADFAKRSAYQAMSSMDRRKAETPDDYFNALIGAINPSPLNSRYDTTLHPAELFMQICEEKGDFSFIYSNAPRSDAPGRSWRPRPGRLPAIQPWHTFGDGQSGSLAPSRLRLHNMARVTRGTLSSTADQFITKWLRSSSGDATSGNTSDQILTRLRQAGFTDCGNPIELEDGYFFPQSAKRVIDDVILFVATGIRWTHGGPGVMVTPQVAGLHRFCDVGVFVGPVPKSNDSIDLA
jgi:hypothetical protein